MFTFILKQFSQKITFRKMRENKTLINIQKVGVIE